MTELSERELREAAEEAGISPAELRQQLAKPRSQNLPASVQRQQGIVATPTRGITARHTENNLALPPGNAVRAVRTAIERQIGQTGHMVGELESDIVDTSRHLTYRIKGEPDGRGGAMVRVDIDPTEGRSTQTMLMMATVLLAGLGAGGWALFGGAAMLLFTLGVLGGGALALTGVAGRNRRNVNQAHAIAATALVDAEERAAVGAHALPPGT